MVKIDIKEFYMSGEPGFLSRACSELFCDETEDFQQLIAIAVGILAGPYIQSHKRVRHRIASQRRGIGRWFLEKGHCSIPLFDDGAH